MIDTLVNDIAEDNQEGNPRVNSAKRRSGRKPGARVTNFVLGEFKVVAPGSWVVKMVCHDVILTDLNNMADYHEWLTLIGQI